MTVLSTRNLMVTVAALAASGCCGSIPQSKNTPPQTVEHRSTDCIAEIAERMGRKVVVEIDDPPGTVKFRISGASITRAPGKPSEQADIIATQYPTGHFGVVIRFPAGRSAVMSDLPDEGPIGTVADRKVAAGVFDTFAKRCAGDNLRKLAQK